MQIDLDYALFAAVLSGALVIMYAVLSVIAFRRARYLAGLPDPGVESVLLHARRIEGPVFTSLLLTSVVLTGIAWDLTAQQFVLLWHLFFAGLRGALFVLAVYVLLFYWSVRDTWLGGKP